MFGARADQIPISATKAMQGHLLGAAGALEGVRSLLAMQHEVALPKLHPRWPDPESDLDDVANAAREGIATRLIMSNPLAVGGTHAVLLLRCTERNTVGGKGSH